MSLYFDSWLRCLFGVESSSDVVMLKNPPIAPSDGLASTQELPLDGVSKGAGDVREIPAPCPEKECPTIVNQVNDLLYFVNTYKLELECEPRQAEASCSSLGCLERCVDRS